MATTVAKLAEELKMPVTVLLEQLRAAGVEKADAGDAVSEQDKARLLDYLRKSHGAADGEKKKITLTRKSTSEIRQSDSSGKARTIQVEVRKKRVLVQRDPQAEAAAAAAAAAAEAAAAETAAHAEAEATRAAEAIAHAAAQAEAEAEAARARQATAAAADSAPSPAAADADAPAVVSGRASASSGSAAAPGTPGATAVPAAPAPAALDASRPLTVIDENQRRIREEESRRHNALRDRQVADLTARQERERADIAAREAQAAQAKRAAEQVKEGTLHKPAAKPGDADKKSAKKPAKTQAVLGAVAWQGDDAAKKRTIKTRGDAPRPRRL